MTSPAPIAIVPVRTPSDLDGLRALFCAYAVSLPVSLEHQDFAAELAGLPGRYAPPAGEALLALRRDGEALGCVAFRPAGLPGACELKRLFVRPAGRGLGIGLALARQATTLARSGGYDTMLLDTLPSMAGALALYRRLGFVEVPPYWPNPLPGILYLSKDLRAG